MGPVSLLCFWRHTHTNIEVKVTDFLRVVLSIIIPPVGVFFKVGFGMHFWLNIILTMLGYIPGLVHAIWVLASKK